MSRACIFSNLMYKCPFGQLSKEQTWRIKSNFSVRYAYVYAGLHFYSTGTVTILACFFTFAKVTSSSTIQWKLCKFLKFILIYLSEYFHWFSQPKNIKFFTALRILMRKKSFITFNDSPSFFPLSWSIVTLMNQLMKIQILLFYRVYFR